MSRRIPQAILALLLPALMAPTLLSAAEQPLTPASVQSRLRANPKGDDAAKLAEDVRQWFGGKENLSKGPNPRVEGTTAVWAIETKGTPKIVSEDGRAVIALTRIGETDVYLAAETLRDGLGMRWAYQVDGERLKHPGAKGGDWAAMEVYSEQPDSREQSDVPKGKLTKMPKFRSKVFEGTSRDWWVYVPAQGATEKAAAVMVFQDGGGYQGFVPTVFDNLIAKKEMPPTVGIFIQPGTFDDGRSNRSFEYDTLSDQYARFLLEEILPETEKARGVKLRRDAAGRAIAGISSGGICAWTVAWERPDEFSKVLSWVGSFTNIASGKSGHDGGHNYEAMVRKTKPKAIRVFLQDGSNDLDNANGNWPLANQTLAKSLAFAGYDYKFVLGEGFHSNLHGRAILPESLRWLWRGWEAELPK